MKLFIAGISLLVLSTHVFAEGKIVRIFQSSSMYMKILVQIDKKQDLKCALLDASGEYLRVDSQWVTPPADEIIMRIDEGSMGRVKSATCWFQ